MTHNSTLCCMLLLFCMTTQLTAGDDWQRDARLVRRLTPLSKELRSGLRQFSSTHQGAREISGDENALLERAAANYVRIQRHLGAIEKRWDEIAVAETTNEEGQILATSLSLAAASLGLENATTLVESFDGTIFETRLNRPIVFRGEVCTEDLLANVAHQINDRRWRARMDERLARFEGRRNTIVGLSERKGASIEVLIGLTAASGQLDDIENETGLIRLGRSILARRDRIRHSLRKGLRISFERIVSILSKPSVKLKIRKPRIRDEILVSVENDLREILEPCDVFLHKTAYQANDWIIPGYFSHAGMWLGDPDEMQALGLFDRARNHHSFEIAQSNRDHLLAGHSLLEGLFTDVAANDFRGYMLPCDVVAVLRLKPQVIDFDQTDIICKALRHLGQTYDFGFDVNSYEKIVCSELIYQAYPSTIAWPTKRVLGRSTFSPDNIGSLASLDDTSPFEVVYFHDGTRAWRGAQDATTEYLRVCFPKRNATQSE